MKLSLYGRSIDDAGHVGLYHSCADEVIAAHHAISPRLDGIFRNKKLALIMIDVFLSECDVISTTFASSLGSLVL